MPRRGQRIAASDQAFNRSGARGVSDAANSLKPRFSSGGFRPLRRVLAQCLDGSPAFSHPPQQQEPHSAAGRWRFETSLTNAAHGLMALIRLHAAVQETLVSALRRLRGECISSI